MKGIGIEILVEEHENILKFIEIMMKSSINVMNGADVDVNKYREYINFARNYADKHHHGKEELILFKVMVEKLGALGNKLINQGMLIEHDMGRLFILTLEEALNEHEKNPSDETRIQIIANSVGYANHLRRHIDKENNVVYTFAQKQLTEEVLDEVDKDTMVFEEEYKKEREFYESWLNKLEMEG